MLYPKEDLGSLFMKWLGFIAGVVGTANFFLVVGSRMKETDYFALAICLVFIAFGFGLYFFLRRLRMSDLEVYRKQEGMEVANLLAKAAFEPALFALVTAYAKLGPDKGKDVLKKLALPVRAILTSYEHHGGYICDATIEKIVGAVTGKISGQNFAEASQDKDIEVALTYRTIGDGAGVPYENHVNIRISGGGFVGTFEALGQVRI